MFGNENKTAAAFSETNGSRTLSFNIGDFFVENRGEFLEKLQRARAVVKNTSVSQPILSKPGPTRLVVGNWSLTSRKDSELHIHNSDGQQQATILRDDLPGFIFESNRGTKHSFTAETSLGKLLFGYYRTVLCL